MSKDTLVREEEYRGCHIELHQDIDYPFDPREGDNLGIMAFYHKRYRLGDHTFTENHFPEPEDLKEYLDRECREDGRGEVVDAIPVRGYDHSQFSIAAGLNACRWPYTCPWDSGWVGYIYTTRQRVKDFLGARRITKKVRQRVRELLLAEVEEYNAYLTGDVYGWLVERRGQCIDSCSGYFGWDEAEEYMIGEAKAAVDAYWAERKAAAPHLEQLAETMRSCLKLAVPCSVALSS